MDESIHHGREAAKSQPEEVRVISNGRFTDKEMTQIAGGDETKSAVAYEISDLARYLLSPGPIEVSKCLMGCEVHYRAPGLSDLKRRILKKLPSRTRSSQKHVSRIKEVLISPPCQPLPELDDVSLKAHFSRIKGMLSPYNPVAKRLAALDVNKVEDILGICEDLKKERTLLKLEGSIQDKINYVAKYLNQDVRITLGSAYIAQDLFEMRGFDFTTHDHEKSHQLVRFVKGGRVKACVLDENDDVQFWVEDVKLIRYLQLLEQSIRRNPELREAVLKCANGEARPFRLFFNREIEIDYSASSPPELYREMFESCHLGAEQQDMVVSSLSHQQIGISFSYIPQTPSGATPRLYTCLSVMHNVRALEPIRKDFPQLYSEIAKRAALCETGRFYLLDSAGGYQNAQ